MGRNRDGAKIPSDGNEEEEEDGEVIILCSTDVERVVPGGEVERKFTQNSSRGKARSTRFRCTKRGTERLVPFRPIYVPNELGCMDYTPEISHGVLVELAEHRKELEKTKSVHDTFEHPDKALDALAIEDKNRQYAAAENYLEDVLHSALATSDFLPCFRI